MAQSTKPKRRTAKAQRTTAREDAFERLQNLGPERLALVESMMMQNITMKKIAEHVQEVMGECKEVKLESLAKQMYRYKQQVMDPRMIVQADNVPQELKDFVLHKAGERLDVVKEMEHYVIVQKQRVEKLLSRERPVPITMDRVSAEMKLLQSQLTDLADVYMDTGVIRRVPRNFTGNINLTTDPEPVGTSSEDADRMLSEVIDLVESQHGHYETPEEVEP